MDFRVSLLLMASVLLSFAPLALKGQEFRIESVGARIGFPANNSGIQFHQVETAASWVVPWSRNLGRQWRLALRADVSAGWLGDPGHDAFICTAGPTLVVGRRDFPFTFEGGISPTFISHDGFGSKNLGTEVQFTTHVGVNVDMGPSVRLTYRLQHMSNAGLGDHNPGLNLNMLGVSYLF